MEDFKRFLKDERAGPTIALKGLTIMLIFIMIGILITDLFYVGISYMYIKTQMDMANRAVISEVDLNALADRKFRIDETLGEAKFYKYLKKNLKLDNSQNATASNLKIVGPIEVLDFEIYNEDEIPTVTNVGTEIKMVSVYSRIQANIKPIFFGLIGSVPITPYIVTDLPDKFIKK